MDARLPIAVTPGMTPAQSIAERGRLKAAFLCFLCSHRCMIYQRLLGDAHRAHDYHVPETVLWLPRLLGYKA